MWRGGEKVEIDKNEVKVVMKKIWTDETRGGGVGDTDTVRWRFETGERKGKIN